MKIKKGDKVLVMVGKYKGKTGTVEEVLAAKNRVRVSGVNTVKRHMKRNTRAGQAGGAIEVHKSIDASNVSLVSPHSDKPVKVGYRGTGKDKIRVDVKTGETI